MPEIKMYFFLMGFYINCLRMLMLSSISATYVGLLDFFAVLTCNSKVSNASFEIPGSRRHSDTNFSVFFEKADGF